MKKRLWILFCFLICALFLRFIFSSVYNKELLKENPPSYSEYYYDENGNLIKQ